MGWIKRVSALLRRPKLSAEHDEELGYHLAMIEELKTGEGLSTKEARLAARRRFGNASRLKEELHDADVFPLLESFARDIRFAVRMLAKHPGFTTLAVLALAVGIGVNTAVFTACKALVLQPLDAKDPARMSTLDPASYLGVAALFLLITILAAYIPARRATLVDPMVALRCE